MARRALVRAGSARLKQDSHTTVDSRLPRNNKSVRLETSWQLLLRRQFLRASILSVLAYALGSVLKYQPKSRKWSGDADKPCLDLWAQEGLAEALTSLLPVALVDTQKRLHGTSSHVRGKRKVFVALRSNLAHLPMFPNCALVISISCSVQTVCT